MHGSESTIKRNCLGRCRKLFLFVGRKFLLLEVRGNSKVFLLCGFFAFAFLLDVVFIAGASFGSVIETEANYNNENAANTLEVSDAIAPCSC